MYRPRKYVKDEIEFVFPFIQEHPFATFIVEGSSLMATHIPVLIEGDHKKWKLYSHIANHNKQRESLKNGAEALVIFHGPQAYISSSWYQEKDISTWDYSAVHLNAKIRLQTPQELGVSLEKLVARFESSQQQPLLYGDIPEKMLQEHLPLITGFWLDPYKVEGIAKLHQSYPRHDVENVIEKLENSENPMDRKLAKEMRRENKL
ncbi:protease synthase/sporulation negative transcriptional regulator PaiB [Pontixanthobacter gangjinensis]|uniref:FMN-binding negative transcriptional regulator n=1 Tax=Christiangramia aestuarii TaxID=1028746 RepID=A0A7K1LNW3_9FLAO|nr:FMN-binding negative transcriptional regulator [Christiangramia aestuarii]MUP42331.1 FMN-binding negative transcriptional regulator [Christiangramia aestuarii]